MKEVLGALSLTILLGCGNAEYRILNKYYEDGTNMPSRLQHPTNNRERQERKLYWYILQNNYRTSDSDFINPTDAIEYYEAVHPGKELTILDHNNQPISPQTYQKIKQGNYTPTYPEKEEQTEQKRKYIHKPKISSPIDGLLNYIMR